MNLKQYISMVVLTSAIALTAGCATGKSQADLQAKAKISQAQAQQTALSKAPNGTVREYELEEENGRLVWSFDIATPGTQDITEVHIDAITGEVVTVETETPAQQAKEAQEKAK